MSSGYDCHEIIVMLNQVIVGKLQTLLSNSQFMFCLQCSNHLKGSQLCKSVRIRENVFVVVIQIEIWEKSVMNKYSGVIYTSENINFRL